MPQRATHLPWSPSLLPARNSRQKLRQLGKETFDPGMSLRVKSQKVEDRQARDRNSRRRHAPTLCRSRAFVISTKSTTRSAGRGSKWVSRSEPFVTVSYGCLVWCQDTRTASDLPLTANTTGET